MEKVKSRKFPFNELSEKDIKSLKILELIRKHGIISRTEISKITGINIVSISQYIKKYITKKLIIEKGFDVSTGGRKPELVELNKNDDFIIGLDIGAGSIRSALIDVGLDIMGKSKASLPGSDIKAAADAACKLIDETIKAAGVARASVKAIGVGTEFGGYDEMSKAIQERSGIATFAGDRPSCAAFGERDLNKNIPSGTMLYIYSGVGSGVVVKEDGSRISALESNYLRPWNEDLGILHMAQNDVARGVGTAMVELAGGRLDGITETVVAAAARKNDEVALSITRSVGMGLGMRTAYLVNLFDPKSIVLGGGLETSGELILSHIRKMVRKMSLKSHAKGVAILPGSLGDEVVALGAATLAAREIFLEA